MTATTLCPRHKGVLVDTRGDMAGQALFKNSKPGALDFKMCDSCRLVTKVHKSTNRMRIKRNKVEFTDDEKTELYARYPGHALPELVTEAIDAPTFLLDDLWPAEWCIVYPLFCAWELRDGCLPNKLSQWTVEWLRHHHQFVKVLAATSRNRNVLTPRAHTKEFVFPKYMTHRLLHALSKLKTKHEPVFATPEHPSIEEWLLLMNKDAMQRTRLDSEFVRGRIIYYINTNALERSSPILHRDIVDLSGYPGLR
jgi:hypothetical protein